MKTYVIQSSCVYMFCHNYVSAHKQLVDIMQHDRDCYEFYGTPWDWLVMLQFSLIHHTLAQVPNDGIIILYGVNSAIIIMEDEYCSSIYTAIRMLHWKHKR